MEYLIKYSRGACLGLTLLAAGPFAAAQDSQGAKLYEAFCAQCHGLTGEGKGINAPELEVAPRNHTDTAEMSARTDEELRKAIAEGGQAVNKSVLMPNWGNHLSAAEIDALVEHLRDLCCRE